MEWLQYPVALIFALTGAVCILAVALGLPGTWALLLVAALIELTDGLYLPGEDPTTFSWPLLAAAAGVAAFGELLEFLAGVLGAKRAGSSTRGAWGSLVGGLIGAVLGVPIPIPLVGSLIGALVGTFVGAMVAEFTVPERSLAGTLKPATGATLGRVLGTLAKIPIALLVWLALTAAAFGLWGV